MKLPAVHRVVLKVRIIIIGKEAKVKVLRSPAQASGNWVS